MFAKFSLSSQELLLNAKKEMDSLNHPYIGTEHLVLAFLKDSNSSVCKSLNGFNIYYDNYKENLLKIFPKCKKKAQFYMYTPLLKRVISSAMYDASDKKDVIYPSIIFSSLISQNDGVGTELLISMGVNLKKLYSSFKRITYNKPSFNLLSTFGINMNSKSFEYDPVYFREDEIKNVFEILCMKNKSNPLLVGKAGTGKTAIVEEVARRIVSRDCPNSLSSYTVFSIPIYSLVAGTKYRGEFEERFNKILKEASNAKVILFIDEVHTIVHAGGAEGAIDAGNILKPFLARSSIKMIGATTTYEYEESIMKDSALNRRFQVVNVRELTKDETLSVLYNLRSIYSSYHNINIPKSSLNYIVNMTSLYIPNGVNPDKSIDVLDLASTRASIFLNSYDTKVKSLKDKLSKVRELKDNAIKNNDFKRASKYRLNEYSIITSLNKLLFESKLKKNTLTKGIINDVIREKTGKNLNYKFNSNKFIKYMNSYSIDDSVTNYFSSFFKNYHSNRGLYSFLFVGGRGTGKSFIPYVISKHFNIHFIKVNMNEYRGYNGLNKFLNNKSLFNDIRLYSNSFILFDNIECASKDVFKVLCDIIKNGHIKDSSLNDVYFNNSLIFMSSNIKFNNIGFDNNINFNYLNDYFGNGFIDNVDKIFYLNSLSYDDIYNIVKRKLNDSLTKFDKDKINYVIDKSDYKNLGASKINKIIKNDLLLQFSDSKNCNNTYNS